MTDPSNDDRHPEYAQCNICGWTGQFLNRELGREGWHCGNCASFSRTRLTMYMLGVLLQGTDLPMFQWPVRKDVKILESSSRGSYSTMLADKTDYCAPEFDPEKIAKGADPRQYSDFQSLKFADGTFDYVIAADVL